MHVEDWIQDVLSFWFEELTQKDWFVRNESVDLQIRKRFLATYRTVAQQVAHNEPTSAKQTLATIIVLDQFPRNLFRDSPNAYATDHIALSLAERAINSGSDLELTNIERQFLYMPFQHAEDVDVQARSMKLYALINLPIALDFAARHKAIIDQFGRFPHRNKVLGRPSTQDELNFLEQPNSSF